MKRTWIGSAAGIFLAAGMICPVFAQEVEAPKTVSVTAAAPASPWIRKTEEGSTLQLQVAVREYVHPDAERARITVAGAVHIGREPFYDELQRILDAHDVVLYEGVKPRRAAEGEARDEASVMLTQSRMRILTTMLESYRKERGTYPQDLAGLLEIWPDAAPAKNPRDAWGNALLYTRHNGESPRFEIVSLGADGEKGGRGAAAEIRMSSEDDQPERRETPQQAEGIQKQLADAMGLVFQLDAMDHTAANWRNSDMAIEDLRDRFRESGVQAESLFGMMDGSSMMGRLSGMLLNMMGSNPQSRGMLKVMMIEMLGDAERMFEQLPGQAAAMMTVLINDRNEVVLADLERLLEEEPEVQTVGIIYGAGHLAHLEQRLVVDFGYEPGETRWLTAMEVDAEAVGIAPAQLRTMRQMIQRSMEAQTRGRRR